MKTSDLIKSCLDSLSPKMVLDLGVGKGRCSKRFLQKAYSITGVDLIKQEIPGINFIQSNIKDFKFNQKYDLIIASLVLHFLKFKTSKEIIKKMKTSTEIKGHNFILTIDEEDGFFKKRPENFYPNEKILKEIYSDWEIIKSGNYETDMEEHDGSEPHKHHISFILARKIK